EFSKIRVKGIICGSVIREMTLRESAASSNDKSTRGFPPPLCRLPAEFPPPDRDGRESAKVFCRGESEYRAAAPIRGSCPPGSRGPWRRAGARRRAWARSAAPPPVSADPDSYLHVEQPGVGGHAEGERG